MTDIEIAEQVDKDIDKAIAELNFSLDDLSNLKNWNKGYYFTSLNPSYSQETNEKFGHLSQHSILKPAFKMDAEGFPILKILFEKHNIQGNVGNFLIYKIRSYLKCHT